MMRKEMACALVVLAGSAGRVFGITAYSAGDPSLAGVTVAQVDGGDWYGIFGPPPPPGGYTSAPVLGVDERVVRNGAGTLDFYYRFSGVSGTPAAVNWIQLSLLPLSAQLEVGYVAGSGGQVPTEGASGEATFGLGEPAEWQYAAFGFGNGGQGAALDATGSAWLLLRTNATAYGEGYLAFTDDPSILLPLPGGPPGGTSGTGVDAPIFIPADSVALPEPGSLVLMMLGVGGMWLRRGRVWG